VGKSCFFTAWRHIVYFFTVSKLKKSQIDNLLALLLPSLSLSPWLLSPSSSPSLLLSSPTLGLSLRLCYFNVTTSSTFNMLLRRRRRLSRRDERRPESLCLHPDSTLQYYNLLKFFIYNYTTTSSSVQLLKLYTMSWFCQNLSSQDLN